MMVRGYWLVVFNWMGGWVIAAQFFFVRAHCSSLCWRRGVLVRSCARAAALPAVADGRRRQSSVLHILAINYFIISIFSRFLITFSLLSYTF